MNPSDAAEQLLAHLASLELGPSSDLAAARHLARLEPAEAAHALRTLVARARQSPEAGRALATASRALMFSPDADLPYAHRGRIYDAAVEFGLSEVSALFITRAPAEGEPEEEKPGAVDPTLAGLTLGHKKMLARQADPDRMARLALEADPRVLRELLLNPRMTEAMVVRIVARRPARAEALMEVWRSPKWSVRMGVRRALALNPSTPQEIALKILPHLVTGDLAQVAQDRAVAPTVRELARKLSTQRGKGRPPPG